MSGNSERKHNIGIVSTRISGTDGVSLEIEKWTEVLERLGHGCNYICGESDRPAERTFVIEHADFRHPAIEKINEHAFRGGVRTREHFDRICDLSRSIKNELYQALLQQRIDLIIAENALTIPMNLPLGLALVELILETGIPCIAHHHDFRWERERYLITNVPDLLHSAFPPPLPEIEHVVINSLSGREFSRRTGMPYRVIPNVMDFANPPPPPDAYALSFRDAVGVGPNDVLVLQPTRIVARKGIEHSIELMARLNDPRFRLVITHSAGDEGTSYRDHIVALADSMNVELICVGDRVSTTRGETPDGERLYSIWDAYQCADIVAYPSTYEGFGNAFLEAVYYRKPIVCNRYVIYRTDIEPYGFRVIGMDGFVTAGVIEQVRSLADDDDARREMTEHNYAIATEKFSFERLKELLRLILQNQRAWTRAE